MVTPFNPRTLERHVEQNVIGYLDINKVLYRNLGLYIKKFLICTPSILFTV